MVPGLQLLTQLTTMIRLQSSARKLNCAVLTAPGDPSCRPETFSESLQLTQSLSERDNQRVVLRMMAEAIQALPAHLLTYVVLALHAACIAGRHCVCIGLAFLTSSLPTKSCTTCSTHRRGPTGWPTQNECRLYISLCPTIEHD